MVATVQLFIDNEFIDSETAEFVEVHDPATNELIARTPLATGAELERAVASSEKAFAEWSETATARRVRFLFKFHQLVQQHTDEIAKIITKEHGKTFADAQGDVFRGLEVVEQACAMMSNMKGGFSDNVATNVDAFSLRQPLGVCAGICPFNFPAMIPLWMLPMAIAAGNTFILKPSERVPGASMYLAKLMKEAGLPKGVLNVVHGSIGAANFICDDKRISAVSFVGSTPAGEAIYKRVKACGGGKRVQCNMGAKNHAVIMPDAARETTLNALLGAAFGAAGQRCMAISVAVFVGDAKDWLDELVERSSKLKVTEGMQQGADLGPLISPQAKARVEGIITRAGEEGARIVLDGRNLQNAEYPNGNFIGPTILADVTTTMECYTTEIFGPVLAVVTAPTLDAAIELCNANPYGNGTAIFTTSGASARKFQHKIDAGLIGVNLPIPVPPPYFTWSSAKHSFAGETHFFGHSAVDFYTRTKTVLTSWREDDGKGRGAGSLVFKAQTK